MSRKPPYVMWRRRRAISASGGSANAAIARQHQERIAKQVGIGRAQLGAVGRRDQARAPHQLPRQALQRRRTRVGQAGQRQAREAKQRSVADRRRPARRRQPRRGSRGPSQHARRRSGAARIRRRSPGAGPHAGTPLRCEGPFDYAARPMTCASKRRLARGLWLAAALAVIGSPAAAADDGLSAAGAAVAESPLPVWPRGAPRLRLSRGDPLRRERLLRSARRACLLGAPAVLPRRAAVVRPGRRTGTCWSTCVSGSRPTSRALTSSPSCPAFATGSTPRQRLKFFATLQLAYDTTEQHNHALTGYDLAFHNSNGLMFEVMPNLGFYVQLGDTVGFVRWLRFEIDLGVGVQARFP